ncbi:MAG: hypothetical protein GW949_02640 [Spirochaetales bacterium]|nr:hypothetical protein [Spirochaetales bacterium]
MSPLLIGRPVDHYDLGDGTIGVLTSNGQVFQLEPDELFLLQNLQQFTPSKDIPTFLERRGWQNEDPNYTEELVAGLLQKGLLLTQDQLKGRLIELGEETPHQEQKSISIINWVTCDRPDLLERGMKSFIENCKQYGHEPLYRVCDDSKSLEMRKKNRSVVDKLAQEYRIDTSYLGYEEKLGLIESLLNQPQNQFTKVELRFLLFGVLPGQEPLTLSEMTAGANANAAYLAAGDNAVLMIDDDLVCETWLAEPTDNSIQLCLDNSGEDFWFYPSYEEMAPLVQPTRIDILKAFNEHLDSPAKLHELLRENLDWNNLSAPLVEFLWTRKPQVALCCAGSHGDSGLGSNVHFRHWGEGAKKKFFPDEKTFQTAMTSRIMRRCPTTLSVCRDSSFQTMCYSLVPSRSFLLFPATRAADDIFWLSSLINNKDLVKIRLPFSLGHYASTNPLYQEHRPKIMDTLTHILLRSKHERLLVSPDSASIYQDFLFRTQIMVGKVVSVDENSTENNFPSYHEVSSSLPVAQEKVELFRSILLKTKSSYTMVNTP